MAVFIITIALAWLLCGYTNILIYATAKANQKKEIKPKTIFSVIIWFLLGTPFTIYLLYIKFKK